MADRRFSPSPAVWRYTQGPNGSTTTPVDAPQCGWVRLLIHHMPFHAASGEEYDRLARLRDDLERLFLANQDPSIRAYYTEAYGVETSQPSEPVLDQAPVRHVVMLQMQLMEEVYYTLRLDRYANAPDNRGWMNLFRRWGRSPTFLRHVDTASDMLTDPFWHFFSAYIRGYDQTIDECPVPHPWDVASSEIYCARPGVRGVFLDAGLREVAGEIGPGTEVSQAEHASPPATEAPHKTTREPTREDEQGDVSNA